MYQSPRSLGTVLAEIASGKTTALAAFDAFRARAAEVEPHLGAIVAEDWETARRAVAASAALPLAGLPVGVKDIFDTADLPTGYGSPIWAGHRPTRDAAVVTRLRAVGATLPVKTTTTEFAFMQPTATRNPWALERSPGGSSSGSAAAVAAGMLPAALGTQTGGSTVRPASFCGITGFKPSFDRLPTPGLKAFAPSLDTVGLFAANVDDVALLFAALEGRPLRLDRAAVGDLRLAVLRLPWDDAASPAAHAALERARTRLVARARGLVDRIPPGPVVAAHAAHPTIQAMESLDALAFERRTAPEKLGPLLTAHFEEADAVTGEALAAAQAVRREAHAALPDLFRDVDALVTFAAPGVAPLDRTTTGSPIFNRLWTLLGVPVVSIPGLFHDGLPIGLQLIGRPGGDEALLTVAAAVAPVIADPH